MKSFPISSAEVTPGYGIGVLKLGTSLFDVLKHFRKIGSVYKFIKIVYSSNALFETPILVYVKNLGIRLTFDAIFQELVLIEVIEFNLIQLIYLANQQVFTINRNCAEPSFRNIYNKIFGPTLPGKVYFDLKTYILSYPGIAFSFDLSDNIVGEFLKGKTSNDQLTATDKEKLIVMLSKSDLKCSSIAIYSKNRDDSNNDWSHFYDDYFKQMIKDADVRTTDMIKFKKSVVRKRIHSHSLPGSSQAKEKRPQQQSQSSTLISWISINLPLGVLQLNFKRHRNDEKSFEIVLNETKQQRVLYALGEPDSTFLKIDSRYQIYNDKPNTCATKEVFHNYFRFGFDILYGTDSSEGATVKKVIIHNSIPNSLYFNKYNKVNWVMKGYEENSDDESKLVKKVPEPTNIFYLQRAKTMFSWDWIQDMIDPKVATSEMYFNEIDDDFFKFTQSEKQGDKTPFDSSRFVLIDRNSLMTFDEEDSDTMDIISDDEDEEDYDEEVEITEETIESGVIGQPNFDRKKLVQKPQKLTNNCASTDDGDVLIDTDELSSDIKPKVRKQSFRSSFRRSSRKNESHRWGQSKLYSHARCIWEVLPDNEAVSSVTLF